MKPQYVDSVNPNTAWCERYAPSFPQIWHLILALILDVGVSALAFIFIHPLIGGVIFILGCSFALAIAFLRIDCIRRIKMDERLHSLCHQIRDQASSILACDDLREYANQTDAFNKMAVQSIAGYFGVRLHSSKIGCVIRLAQESDKGTQVYMTRAVSDGMHPRRLQMSEPIPSDVGLAQSLRQVKNQGVFIISDIPHAISIGMWKKTESDDLDDIKILMVCPVNAIVKSQKTMIGILYVTTDSGNERTFVSADTLPLKAIADTLGLAYAVILGRISLNVKREIHGGS